MTEFTIALRTASIVALMLAASCASPVNDGGALSSDGAVNHPIQVAPHFASIKLPFSVPQAGLLPDDAARLDGFVADYLSRGTGSISVSAPAGSDSAAAIEYFAARLFSLGVPHSRILVGTHDGDSRVEIGYIAYEAQADECGDWPKNLGDTAGNATSANFGCAVQKNIAAQIADPRDLVEPRQADGADAARRAVVIDNYEKGKVTAADKTPSQSGAVSDVNKN